MCIRDRLYNRGEALLGNRTRPFDAILAGLPPADQSRILARWQAGAARTMRHMSLLSANGRTIAIWLAVLVGEPMLYWAWEILPLTLLALAAARSLRQSETEAVVNG